MTFRAYLGDLEALGEAEVDELDVAGGGQQAVLRLQVPGGDTTPIQSNI